MGKKQRPFGTPHKAYLKAVNDQRLRTCHTCGRTLTLTLDNKGWRQWCKHLHACTGGTKA